MATRKKPDTTESVVRGLVEAVVLGHRVPLQAGAPLPTLVAALEAAGAPYALVSRPGQGAVLVGTAGESPEILVTRPLTKSERRTLRPVSEPTVPTTAVAPKKKPTTPKKKPAPRPEREGRVAAARRRHPWP